MGDDDGRQRTIKCALGRLQPSIQLRSAIESTVERLHVIALRGSFVATEAWTASTDNPPLIDQTWWFRCFASTYSTKRGKCDVGDEAINAAREKLFADVSPVQGDYIWSFVAELARDAMTMTHNMVASSFHKQIQKAFRREVALHEVEANVQLDKSLRHQLVSHYYDRAVGHQRASAAPPDFSNAKLEGAMSSLLADWSDLMETVGLCPTDDFIYNDRKHLKLPALMSWMARLQQHRLTCIERMVALVGSREEAQRRFRRLARAQAPLPFFSWQVKHIAVSNTGLKALLQMAGSCASKAKPTFEEHLPGLARFQKPLMPFQNYLRTDGVSVSLVMQAKTDGKKLRKRHRKAAEQSFPVPLPGQRVVGIDPGRRDLLALVSNQEGDSPFTVSTKSMEVETGRRQARIHARRVLRSCRVTDEDGTEASLLQKLCSLPSRREDWAAFCEAALPVLDTIARCFEKKSLRRQRFASYMKRDQALDELCKRIMGGKLRGPTGRKRYTPGQRGTLVAFGAANACSTGFGYAPAPQERLRRRLEKIHGARVFLVDEFRTSQLCCKCHQQLEKVTVQQRVRGKLRRFQPHGLRRCATCHNEKGAPLYCHRDVNAAKNILACFLSKATLGQRPEVFTRQQDSQTNRCPVGHGLGFAVRISSSEEKPSKRTRRA